MEWKIERVEGSDVSQDDAIELYRSSGLGDRRPVDDIERFRTMLDNANLVLACYQDGLLLGLARSVSDFSYVTYLSDIAVRREYQRSGIGRALISATYDEAPMAKIVLLAAPASTAYYSHIGFTAHGSAWVLTPEGG